MRLQILTIFVITSESLSCSADTPKYMKPSPSFIISVSFKPGISRTSCKINSTSSLDYFIFDSDCYYYDGLFYTEVVDKINLLDFCNYIYGDKVLEVRNRGLFIKKESN